MEPDGPYADPRIEGASMVITPNTEGSAHVHPSGVITTTDRVIEKTPRAFLERVPRQEGILLKMSLHQPITQMLQEVPI